MTGAALSAQPQVPFSSKSLVSVCTAELGPGANHVYNGDL